MSAYLIHPQWPAPKNVNAFSTTRIGGHSRGVYAGLNLGQHVGDTPHVVEQNRMELPCPQRRYWLDQVHGNRVITLGLGRDGDRAPQADGSLTTQSQAVCLVMTADCLPLLLCDEKGTQVAAIHCGWRSLASGIVGNAVSSFASTPRVIAWMGPSISAANYEVGDDVWGQFSAPEQEAFLPGKRPGKWQLDLYALARIQLQGLGVKKVFGGQFCTYADPRQFFSHRRDGITGRMVSAIWLD